MKAPKNFIEIFGGKIRKFLKIFLNFQKISWILARKLILKLIPGNFLKIFPETSDFSRVLEKIDSLDNENPRIWKIPIFQILDICTPKFFAGFLKNFWPILAKFYRDNFWKLSTLLNTTLISVVQVDNDQNRPKIDPKSQTPEEFDPQTFPGSALSLNFYHKIGPGPAYERFLAKNLIFGSKW